MRTRKAQPRQGRGVLLLAAALLLTALTVRFGRGGEEAVPTLAGPPQLRGTTVVIDHDGGYQTTYANLQATPTVQEGDTVSAGEIIGAVGTTAAAETAQGPHLHFGVTLDGEAVDPQEFLNS